MEDKKYELVLSDTKTIFQQTVYRIRALKDFDNVSKGDLGGYIASEKNLSHNGNCWIYKGAIVFKNAKVYDNAKISQSLLICENAQIFGNAIISGLVTIHGNAKIYGNTIILGNALIGDNAEVYGHTLIRDKAQIYENTIINGDVEIIGSPEFIGDAVISNNKDYLVFKNWWGSNILITWTRSNNKYNVEYISYTGEELIEEAYHYSEIDGREYERIVKYVESILKDDK